MEKLSIPLHLATSGSAAPHAPPTHRPWLAVSSLALGAFAVVTSEILPVGLLTDVASHYHVSAGTVGWMMTAPGIAAALAALVLSMAIGRLDRRTLLLALSSLMLLANVVIALAPSWGWVLAARVLSGVSVGGFWAFALVAARRLVPAAKGDRAVTWVVAGVSAGTVLGVPAAKPAVPATAKRKRGGVMNGSDEPAKAKPRDPLKPVQ